MATSSHLNIKSAARKLPIKRKDPPQPNSQPVPAANPNPSPNPNHAPHSSYPLALPFSQSALDDDDPDADYEEEPEDEGGGESRQPPFKFHRIWPESDEIRFLQGLLGCWPQGLVFPRDLNIFYDRFSESMSQPYTRSQLSEKLRRLRKKYRTMAGRIARGQDPSRLSQHDRDLLHLSTRLWDPSNASTSPFSSPDAVPAGSAGNKRRRPNPRAPIARIRTSSSSQSQLIVALESAPFQHPTSLLALPPIASPASSSEEIKEFIDPPAPVGQNISVASTDVTASQKEIPNKKGLLTFPSNGSVRTNTGTKLLTIKSILNVFDGALNEVRTTLADQGSISPDGASGLGSEMNDMSKRFQEQRLAELDLLARRWRLLIEQKVSQV